LPCRYWKCDIKRSTPDKLAGKKIGVKDNVAVAGVPMMNESKILEAIFRDQTYLLSSEMMRSYKCFNFEFLI
jgi:hypothetical protein